MSYGRVCIGHGLLVFKGATVTHSAELVRGGVHATEKGPLIRPSRRRRAFGSTGTFSPRGEGAAPPLYPIFTPQAAAHMSPSTVPRRGLYSQPTQPL